MIDQIDEALRTIVTREVLNGSGAEISFEAPTTEWAARRTTPTLDIYLYDIREDLERREVFYEDVRDAEGRVVARQPRPRRFALSYIITAWTQRPEDEHRLLSSALACFLAFDALPGDVLDEPLNDPRYPLVVKIGLPPPEDRSTSDLWTALGGDLKPSLDLVIVAPVTTTRSAHAGPPVTEHPRIAVVGRRGDSPPAAERPPRPVQERQPMPAVDPGEAVEEVTGGTPEAPGRRLQIHALPPVRRGP